MNLIERWLARRDPRRRQPHESRAIWQTRRLAERSEENPPQLGPPILPQDAERRAKGCTHPADEPCVLESSRLELGRITGARIVW